MNDPISARIWEGAIEVLHGEDPVLTASARLWRRDDLFGTDWGGQLRIPVAQRRALPAGEYRIVLGPGHDATAFIGFGASDTASTFPTLTGHGTPPFGGTPTEADPAAFETFQGFDGSEGIAGVEGIEAIAEALAAPARQPVAVGAASAGAAPDATHHNDERQDPHMTDPTPEASTPVEATPAPPARPVEAAQPAPIAALDPAIEQTEALARAFLCAVEVRQQLQSMRGQGLEANVLASLRAIVDEVTGHIESRLRSQQAQTISARVEGHLVVLGWLRIVIADVTDRGDLADLSRTIGRLVEALDPAARSRAASQERAAA